MTGTMNRYILIMFLALLMFAAAPGTPASAQEAAADTSMALEGGKEGTVFKSMTIEGEDRVRIEFERPPLVINLDPGSAPGLDWENTWEVLDRSNIDFVSPLIGLSALESSSYMPRPWFDEFSTGDIVRFRPALKDVDRWKMTIADSRSQTVAVFEGKGNPPKEIGWNGLSLEGKPMPPGLTYSYVLEAYDRAGNKRNFVGEGFELPSYIVDTEDGLILVFSGSKIESASKQRRSRREVAPAILLDAATRLNQFAPNRAIRIEATARTYNNAKVLAQAVAQSLEPLLLGDPNLIQQVTGVQADAPAGGTVAIIVSR